MRIRRIEVEGDCITKDRVEEIVFQLQMIITERDVHSNEKRGPVREERKNIHLRILLTSSSYYFSITQIAWTGSQTLELQGTWHTGDRSFQHSIPASILTAVNIGLKEQIERHSCSEREQSFYFDKVLQVPGMTTSLMSVSQTRTKGLIFQLKAIFLFN